MSERRPRCCYCHDDLAAASVATLRCAGCGALLHPDCAAALDGRCPTLGCPTFPRLGCTTPGYTAPRACAGHDRPLSWTGRALLGLLGWATRA